MSIRQELDTVALTYFAKVGSGWCTSKAIDLNYSAIQSSIISRPTARLVRVVPQTSVRVGCAKHAGPFDAQNVQRTL